MKKWWVNLIANKSSCCFQNNVLAAFIFFCYFRLKIIYA
ncbi:MAG: hypothetical protein MRERV_15c009 [Mycoplasmataceae bacterium RV_VA103A]|nr:MAG: hypothetical protein MRERV_15c009 [Mycoplasmataceae bacterium RV_VA103A]